MGKYKQLKPIKIYKVITRIRPHIYPQIYNPATHDDQIQRAAEARLSAQGDPAQAAVIQAAAQFAEKKIEYLGAKKEITKLSSSNRTKHTTIITCQCERTKASISNITRQY